VTVRGLAPLLRTGLVGLAAACGAATEPTVIEMPGGPGDGGGSGDSAGGSSGADATTEAPPFDAASEGASSSHPDSGDAAGMSTGTGDDGAVCTPVAVMDVPVTGGAACTPSSASTTCYPHDETTFSPTWVPPLPRGFRCSPMQITDFYDLCLGASATGTSCGTWTAEAANATCLGCLKTPSTAPAYGVFIGFPGDVVELNEAGCVALAEPCNLVCAQTWLASIECREASCTQANCPAQSDQVSCATESAACSACEGYAEAAACMTELTGADHPGGALCAIGSDEGVTMDDYVSVATFMCGN
jgi:hypothetical protein